MSPSRIPSSNCYESLFWGKSLGLTQGPLPTRQRGTARGAHLQAWGSASAHFALPQSRPLLEKYPSHPLGSKFWLWRRGEKLLFFSSRAASCWHSGFSRLRSPCPLITTGKTGRKGKWKGKGGSPCTGRQLFSTLFRKCALASHWARPGYTAPLRLMGS